MKRVFYGWRMVAAGCAMQFVQSTLLLQSFGAYFAMLRDDRGWSKTELAGAAALHQMESAILGPVLGWILDRFGPRGVIRAGIVPVSIFALNAVRNINSTHLRSARVMRLSPWQTARAVLIPAALPEIVTGTRVGFSLALIGTLLGEMFGSQRGIGHLLMQAMSLHNIERIMSLTLLLVLFAAGVNAALLAWDRRLHRAAALTA